ncbi:MAG: hypothetical protein KAF24_02600 [Nitrosopumilaceae archaeon]|nr:hypothetical protein [Nitrosopumilaceae archaeon]
MSFLPIRNLRIKTYHDKNIIPTILQKIQLLTGSISSTYTAFVNSLAVKTDIAKTTKNSIAYQIQDGNDSFGI